MTNDIDTQLLSSVCGGNTTTPQQPPQKTPRSWGQVAADYASSCAQNAASAVIFQGRPTSLGQVAVTAGLGCAVGLATQATKDWADSYDR